jgi:hypothetical protein
MAGFQRLGPAPDAMGPNVVWDFVFCMVDFL